MADPHEILISRERRGLRIQAMLQAGSSVISCTLNIPGETKTNDSAQLLSKRVLHLLLAQLKRSGFAVLQTDLELGLNTGPEWRLRVATDADVLKQMVIRIEETREWGRILDLDVFDPNGEQLSRPNKRKCFLCDNSALVCSRSRTHSIEDIITRAWRLIEEGCAELADSSKAHNNSKEGMQ